MSFKSGRMLFLQVQGAGEGDVAVKMAFVKFVEENGRDSAQLWVVNHLPQQNPFGHKTDFRFGRCDILETNLVADLFAEFRRRVPAPRARRAGVRPAGAAGGSPPGHRQEAVLQKHLRHLRGFARTGGRGQNQAAIGFQTGDDVLFDFINGQSHEATMVPACPQREKHRQKQPSG